MKEENFRPGHVSQVFQSDQFFSDNVTATACLSRRTQHNNNQALVGQKGDSKKRIRPRRIERSLDRKNDDLMAEKRYSIMMCDVCVFGKKCSMEMPSFVIPSCHTPPFEPKKIQSTFQEERFSGSPVGDCFGGFDASVTRDSCKCDQKVPNWIG